MGRQIRDGGGGQDFMVFGFGFQTGDVRVLVVGIVDDVAIFAVLILLDLDDVKLRHDFSPFLS